MSKRKGKQLLPLRKRLTPAQKKRRLKKMARREAEDTYTEQK